LFQWGDELLEPKIANREWTSRNGKTADLFRGFLNQGNTHRGMWVEFSK